MIYVDTSAFLKTAWAENGSAELREYAGHREDLVASRLLELEARRGALRVDPSAVPRIDLLLARYTLIGVSDAVVETASRLPSPYLRSLDAVHLATALLLGDELDALLTYDDRLADAARSHGITVVSPGA
ncbi:type II toxin-antitoxin system VapC family toxin [Pseudonocardia phyllosphaerae]|uniref:type II toxin-antitoxin system VapC family toxin n=1 Tax=Pseudonocardia phyllosphaerae TaxID=3390502 RepID=UPI00397A22D8